MKNNIITFPKHRCRPADTDTMVIVQSIFPAPQNFRCIIEPVFTNCSENERLEAIAEWRRMNKPQRFNPDF